MNKSSILVLVLAIGIAGLAIWGVRSDNVDCEWVPGDDGVEVCARRLPESASGSGAESESQDEPASDSGDESESQDEPASDSGDESESQDEPASDSGDESEPQDEPASDSGDESESQDEPASDSEAESAPAEPGAPVDVRPEKGSDDYLEPFDTAASLDDLDFFLANGASFNNRPTQWPGDHAEGGTCGNPNTTRSISWPGGEEFGGYSTTDPGETAYWCAPGGPGSGHFMSSFLTGGYGLLSFAPQQTFSDVRTVCYDVNATNLGKRKWHQVVIVDASIAADVAPRLDWTDNAFADSGPGSKGLPVTDDTFMFTSKQGSASVNGSGDSSNKTDKSVSDQIKRVTTCLFDRGNGNIEVVQERWDGSVDSSTLSGSFPSGDVRVVWQDVVYNANKAKDQERDSETWHWDNLYVSSEVPATVAGGA